MPATQYRIELPLLMTHSESIPSSPDGAATGNGLTIPGVLFDVELPCLSQDGWQKASLGIATERHHPGG
jgi:hypothetical protein